MVNPPGINAMMGPFAVIRLGCIGIGEPDGSGDVTGCVEGDADGAGDAEIGDVDVTMCAAAIDVEHVPLPLA